MPQQHLINQKDSIDPVKLKTSLMKYVTSTGIRLLNFNVCNFIYDNKQLAFDNLYKAIIDAQEKHQPLKMAKITDDKPWMTTESKPISLIINASGWNRTRTESFIQ